MPDACSARITVRYPYSDFDPPQPDKNRDLMCCHWVPHDGLKHFNPSLLLALGGSHIRVEGWSPWTDTVNTERCPECAGVLNASLTDVRSSIWNGSVRIEREGHREHCERNPTWEHDPERWYECRWGKCPHSSFSS